MGLQIDDGTGLGYSVKVNKNNQLRVAALSEPMVHWFSHIKGQVYQVIATFASVNNSTHTLIHLRNDSATHKLVITKMNLQFLDFAGGTALPSVNSYFSAAFARTVSSGGTTYTPVNLNRESGNTATVTATINNPTMAGTAVEFERWFPKAAGEIFTWDKAGSIVLGKNNTMEIRITSNHTSGVAYGFMEFMMKEAD